MVLLDGTAGMVLQVQANILAALGSDTASLSALRCLKLYLERIGGEGGAPKVGGREVVQDSRKVDGKSNRNL